MAVASPNASQLGLPAVPFNLPTANPWIHPEEQDSYSLDSFADSEFLAIIFTCNHCPYAIHVEDELIRIANTYGPRVQLVAINSNDAKKYPADSFEAMQKRAQDKSFPFPYLYDASQELARLSGAVCTPDPFVYDANRMLVYRGRIDETRPGQGIAAHGSEFRAALDALLAGANLPSPQYPSIGCSIKWK